MKRSQHNPPIRGWRKALYEVIFEADTPARKWFDILLIVSILLSVTVVIVFGSLMYLVEGESNGFTSIPRGIYWAVVTLTTVGYGDISPQTGLGQVLASLIMIMGYGLIAVPTGIVSVEISHAMEHKAVNQACPACSAQGHDKDAQFCKYCGAPL